MKKWDYHVGLVANVVDPESINAALNRSGDEGWELVAAIPESGGLCGPVLLAIDAVMMQRLFTHDRKAWPNDDNEEQLRSSTQKLLDLVEREHVPLVVFGHDGHQWQTLKKAPSYYD